MTNKNLNGIIPEADILENEQKLISACDEIISDYMVFFKNVEFSRALRIKLSK